MRPLSAAVLLEVWERGHGTSPSHKALLLLAAAFPDEAAESLAKLPVGRRDARLMALRAATFGDRLDCVVRCPSCGEQLHLGLSIAELSAGAPHESPEALAVEAAGYTVRFRLPSTRDVQDAAAHDSGAARLFERCILEARKGDAPVEADELPESVVATIADEMEAADPQAWVVLDLTCPDCAHGWKNLFDVVSYFWTEIDSWARRMLREVHDLALAYGWSEAAILEMSALRRRRYLTLINE